MGSETSGQERRKQPRVSAGLPVKLGSDRTTLITQTKNISTLGLFCRVDAEFPLMTRISVTLFAPVPTAAGKTVTRKVNCDGIVIRSERVSDAAGAVFYNLAVYFSELNEAQRKIIDRYVQHNQL